MTLVYAEGESVERYYLAKTWWPSVLLKERFMMCFHEKNYFIWDAYKAKI